MVSDGFIVMANGDLLDPVARLFAPSGSSVASAKPIEQGDISPVCLALSLAGITRFAGQGVPPVNAARTHATSITVAQHACMIADRVHTETTGAVILLQALHHEDGRAFGIGGDINWPSAHAYPHLFDPIREAQRQLAIAVRFALRVPSYYDALNKFIVTRDAADDHPAIVQANREAYALSTVFMPRSSRWPSLRSFGPEVGEVEDAGLWSSWNAAAAWLALHRKCEQVIKHGGYGAPVPRVSPADWRSAHGEIMALARPQR